MSSVAAWGRCMVGSSMGYVLFAYFSEHKCLLDGRFKSRAAACQELNERICSLKCQNVHLPRKNARIPATKPGCGFSAPHWACLRRTARMEERRVGEEGE